jgi:hypothetical protein
MIRACFSISILKLATTSSRASQSTRSKLGETYTVRLCAQESRTVRVQLLLRGGGTIWITYDVGFVGPAAPWRSTFLPGLASGRHAWRSSLGDWPWKLLIISRYYLPVLLVSAHHSIKDVNIGIGYKTDRRFHRKSVNQLKANLNLNFKFKNIKNWSVILIYRYWISYRVGYWHIWYNTLVVTFASPQIWSLEFKTWESCIIFFSFSWMKETWENCIIFFSWMKESAPPRFLRKKGVLAPRLPPPVKALEHWRKLERARKLNGFYWKSLSCH